MITSRRKMSCLGIIQSLSDAWSYSRKGNSLGFYDGLTNLRIPSSARKLPACILGGSHNGSNFKRDFFIEYWRLKCRYIPSILYRYRRNIRWYFHTTCTIHEENRFLWSFLISTTIKQKFCEEILVVLIFRVIQWWNPKAPNGEIQRFPSGET